MRASKLDNFIEDTLQFECLEAAVTGVKYPYSTGWRTLPFAVVSQWRGSPMLFEWSGGEPIHTSGDAAILVPPGVKHCVTVMAESPTVCRWAHVQFKALGSISVLSLIPTPRIFNSSIGEQLGSLSEELARTRASESQYSLAGAAQRKQIGFSLLALICEITELQTASVDFFSQANRLLPVLQYIQGNLSGEITRDTLAQYLDLSPTHFHSIFKEIMGISPMDYVRRLRIQQAQRLLVETELGVAEVGEQTGFGDAFHFSRMFKSMCGSSPSHYRQEVRRGLFGG